MATEPSPRPRPTAALPAALVGAGVLLLAVGTWLATQVRFSYGEVPSAPLTTTPPADPVFMPSLDLVLLAIGMGALLVGVGCGVIVGRRQR